MKRLSIILIGIGVAIITLPSCSVSNNSYSYKVKSNKPHKGSSMCAHQKRQRDDMKSFNF